LDGLKEHHPEVIIEGISMDENDNADMFILSNVHITEISKHSSTMTFDLEPELFKCPPAQTILMHIRDPFLI